MQVKIFYLNLQTKTPMKILKILIFNFPFVFQMVKKHQDTKTIKFQFDFTNGITDEYMKKINI